MSIQDLISAAVPADGLHSPATAHISEQSSDMDTEMTCPLTSGDDDSTRSRSSSPIQLESMSSFQSARERNMRGGAQSRAVRSNSLAQGSLPGTARHPEMASSLPTPSFAPTGQYDPNNPMMSTPRGNRGLFILGENSIPLSSVCPGAVWPTKDQLDTAYAYGIRREDGSFTRLLRADEFPTAGIPPCQGPEGLMILPSPMQHAPSPSIQDRMVPMEVVQQLPPVNLVVQRPGLPMRPVSYDSTQQHIDSIVQSSTVSPPARRREKIFCDKWIHEGVCAFTQMGCKYKHEMPLDRATQLTLGLNHGIPSWYRRAYAITLRPSSPPMPPVFSSPNNGRRTEGPWRRLEGLPPKMGNNGNGNGVNQGTYGNSMGGGMQSGSRGGNRSAFGPIGPPPQNQNQNFSNNPYSTLKVEEEAEDDDEDEMLYKGRNR
ncbi:hypothetical protein IFR05_001057 [Cadophora sp. M221]|nr:hypothetical protein IFR05_001057 [Cadophora sp. M221]